MACAKFRLKLEEYMSKYKPFAEYLQNVNENSLHFTFADVERILGFSLPPAARKYPAWWANSRTKDSHTWAHLWIKTGWECDKYSLSAEWVTFKKTEYYSVDDIKAQEGYEYDAKIILRKRNAALALARKVQDGYICQACGYHLQVNGAYVIEVHHIDPLSITKERETKISKLVSLCPNCHRIAHLRSTPYSVDEIKTILKTSIPTTL